MREAALSRDKGLHLALRFADHVEDGIWILIRVHEALLRTTGILMLAAPLDLFIRTADAVHLTTAHEIGERDVWTNNPTCLLLRPILVLPVDPRNVPVFASEKYFGHFRAQKPVCLLDMTTDLTMKNTREPPN